MNTIETNRYKQTTLEDRVQRLEEEVSRIRDTLIWIEADIEERRETQQKNQEDTSEDIKLKIGVDTSTAIKQLQRIQKALITDEQLEQVKQELREYWKENIYQKNPPTNHNLLPKAEKEQLEKWKNGEIKDFM